MDVWTIFIVKPHPKELWKMSGRAMGDANYIIFSRACGRHLSEISQGSFVDVHEVLARCCILLAKLTLGQPVGPEVRGYSPILKSRLWGRIKGGLKLNIFVDQE